MSKRILSVMSKEVHSKAMRAAYGSKQLHPGPDCAYCRNSRYNGSAFVCSLNHPGDALQCQDFKDSRSRSSENPGQLAS